MPGPLADVRIIDLTAVVLGPYATQILGDLGADIVKVEPPEGDNVRYVGAARTVGMGPNYLHLNRNKRSIVLDLKHPRGREAMLKLVESADVLVYNLRPQSMARLGLSYADCAAVNPRIIYVGAFGYGQDGPYAAKPAYDDLIQGATGIPFLMLESGSSEPRYVPLTLVDRIIGLNTANAVNAALYHRERTGEGQSVEVPMFESMAQFVLGDHLGGRSYEPAAGPTGYARILSRDRRPYRTKDGFVCALVYNDKQWQAFLRLIGRPEMFRDEPRFSSLEARAKHIDEFYAFIAESLLARTTAEWLQAFEEADIPAMPMNTPDDLITDEHMRAVGFFFMADHPSEGKVRMTRVPSRWSASPPQLRRHAPRLGEHSVEVLREAGYSDADIRALLAERVTASPPPD